MSRSPQPGDLVTVDSDHHKVEIFDSMAWDHVDIVGNGTVMLCVKSTAPIQREELVISVMHQGQVCTVERSKVRVLQ